jgi:hypothetical protein
MESTGVIENSTLLEGNLNLKTTVNQAEYIPCLFLKGSKDKIILFFHANGEDISSAFDFLSMVNN